MQKPIKKITIIENTLMGMPLNRYAVEHTHQGLHLLGITGCEVGLQFFYTHKEYRDFFKCGNYRVKTAMPYSFVESYMHEYQCACVEAINCLLAPANSTYTFANGRVKQPHAQIV